MKQQLQFIITPWRTVASQYYYVRMQYVSRIGMPAIRTMRASSPSSRVILKPRGVARGWGGGGIWTTTHFWVSCVETTTGCSTVTTAPAFWRGIQFNFTTSKFMWCDDSVMSFKPINTKINTSLTELTHWHKKYTKALFYARLFYAFLPYRQIKIYASS
jgi:hypothetical protein